MMPGNPPLDARPVQRRRRFLLAFNPTAGPRRPAALERVRAALAARGASVIDVPASSAEVMAARIVTTIERDDVDAVLAAGGDGTIRRVAAVAAPRGVPVGIVPLGTGNVMAHEIGLPAAPSALAGVLMDGSIARIRGGTVNGEPFFLWVGAGFDGRVVSGLDHAWKRRIGKLAYGRAIAMAIGAKSDEIEVVVDGAREAAAWVIVTNASRYGGRFTLTQATRLTEPGLVTLLFRKGSRTQLVRALSAIALGGLPRLEARGDLGVVWPSRHVLIKAPRPVPAQVDGDPFGMTPLEVRDDGPELHLIVPPGPR